VKKVRRKKPTVPKATDADLACAARISNEMLTVQNVGQQYSGGGLMSSSTLQRMMLMERGSSLASSQGMPSDVGAGGPARLAAASFGSFAGTASPVRSQMSSAIAAAGSDSGIPYGGGSYGMQWKGEMRSAPPM